MRETADGMMCGNKREMMSRESGRAADRAMGAVPNRTMNESCGQLRLLIDQVSFAMDDVVLYLDTHPCDQQALDYYQYVRGLRKEAMEAYAAQCGPLTKDQINEGNYWNWVNDPWPWEGGGY